MLVELLAASSSHNSLQPRCQRCLHQPRVLREMTCAAGSSRPPVQQKQRASDMGSKVKGGFLILVLTLILRCAAKPVSRCARRSSWTPVCAPASAGAVAKGHTRSRKRNSKRHAVFQIAMPALTSGDIKAVSAKGRAMGKQVNLTPWCRKQRELPWHN